MTAATVQSSYLGFGLVIGERSVGIVLDGRPVCSVNSVSEARRFVKGWRREARKEATA
jgi:hypothetical protein